MKFNKLLTICIILGWIAADAQVNPIYENLPTGKYAVGFKIITINDDSRVSMPEYNYLGEKHEGDRTKKITIHLWYPAVSNSDKRKITYGEYAYNHLLNTTGESITTERISRELTSRRGSVRSWFGEPSDEAWKKLLSLQLLAQPEATPEPGKFPLLIGMLRPLSTSITIEMLASNGYVIAMVKYPGMYQAPLSNTVEIADMQHAIAHVVKSGIADETRIGAFGFSGSGFTQILFGMYDYRIKAVADLESGLYMEGLYQQFSASNYYNPSRLRVPFLHIFSKDLSKQEKYIDDFEKKTKFSERYQLLLNQPGLHHWDFAAEGYASCLVLKNRGVEQGNIQKSFELVNIYLLNFFNAKLMGDTGAQSFLASKPTLSATPSALWDIKLYSALKPPPNSIEFEAIIRVKGIEYALEIVRNTIKSDSSSNLWQGFVLNRLGSLFLTDKKYPEAIGVFKLNTEFHPDDANLHDSLAEGYEAAGDKTTMKLVSKRVLDLLGKKETLTDFEKSLKETAEQRLKN
jgi:hypothetical protein